MTSPIKKRGSAKDVEMKERESALRKLTREAKKEKFAEPGQRIKVEVTSTLDPCGIHKDLYAQAITSGVRRYKNI